MISSNLAVFVFVSYNKCKFASRFMFGLLLGVVAHHYCSTTILNAFVNISIYYK